MSNAAAPKLECDLVMSGGITSGLVYPRAVAWLAETYRFRSIGGTSAGAVAAAATAAAALGVRNGNDQFQTRIKGLPSELATEVSGKTVLERLFQPQKSMRRLFGVLMASLGREPWTAKAARLIAAICTGYWLFVLADVAITLVPLLVLAYAYEVAGAAFWLLLATGLVLAVVLAALAAAYGVGRDIFRRLPQNRYGMCSLSSKGKPDEAGILPLTDWLHELLQSVACRKIHDAPVTFGDLWGNDGQEESERDIELVLMTTNVTRGVSHRFPFLEGSWGQHFFKESDFSELFPASVVLWMKRHAQARRHTDVTVPPGYFGLPEPANLPILLGARMSLSFPFLVSAVPLYTGNPINKSADGKIPLERCWFSDGGLTSNFPLHFFDAPLPSRPTFGINLVPATVYMAETAEDEQTVSSSLKPDSAATAGANPWSHIYMPSRNASGIGSAARFNEFEGKKGSVTGLFGALFDTARNWGDTELMAMPGYRDRIVHVGLDPDEGGLNLNMPEDVIARIGERGERAGELLAARFCARPCPQYRAHLGQSSLDPLSLAHGRP
jgi:predicted acylesterase/phospholipase RssA